MHHGVQHEEEEQRSGEAGNQAGASDGVVKLPGREQGPRVRVLPRIDKVGLEEFCGLGRQTRRVS